MQGWYLSIMNWISPNQMVWVNSTPKLLQKSDHIHKHKRQKEEHIPTNLSARSKKFSARTVCITETSRNPVHSKFGRKTSDTTQGSISTKCTWRFSQSRYPGRLIDAMTSKSKQYTPDCPKFQVSSPHSLPLKSKGHFNFCCVKQHWWPVGFPRWTL